MRCVIIITFRNIKSAVIIPEKHLKCSYYPERDQKCCSHPNKYSIAVGDKPVISQALVGYHCYNTRSQALPTVLWNNNDLLLMLVI